jgi:hypothetical protein
MPVTCPYCSRVNPDGVNFCENCGRPIAAAAVPPAQVPLPPAAPPPPVPLPPVGAPPMAVPPVAAYAPVPAAVPPPPPSAYYTPPAPAPPAKHLPQAAIFGIIGGVVALAIVVGLVVAFAHHGPTPPPNPTPIFTPGPSATAQPSATPVPPRPTPGPPPPPGGATKTQFLLVPKVAGFTSTASSDGQSVDSPADDKSGDWYVYISALDPGTTIDQFKQLALAGDMKHSPDAAPCGQDAKGQANAGAIPATIFSVCGTWTTSSGSFAFQDAHIAAITQNAGGQTVVLDQDLFAPADKFKTFVGELGSGLDHVGFYGVTGAPTASVASGSPSTARLDLAIMDAPRMRVAPG